MTAFSLHSLWKAEFSFQKFKFELSKFLMSFWIFEKKSKLFENCIGPYPIPIWKIKAEMTTIFFTSPSRRIYKKFWAKDTNNFLGSFDMEWTSTKLNSQPVNSDIRIINIVNLLFGYEFKTWSDSDAFNGHGNLFRLN